jgi:acylphosphatase
MKIARAVKVTGRVQGVFFRAWTAEEARSLGLCGWVRNSSGGFVEAHLEGDERAVGELVDRMRNGPPEAHVTNLEVSEATLENLERFEVRH